MRKKCIYIGHAYHEKTKSTKFLIDYLSEYYDMDICERDPYIDDNFDYSIINNAIYSIVIFFQILPPLNEIKKIKHKNIIFFPMYDAVLNIDLNDWRYYKNFKIINFSKTLDKTLKKMGFNTLYLQYFLEPIKFIPEDRDKVFFWHRRANVNINIVEKILANYSVNVFFHNAMDPNEKLIEPSKHQEEILNITYSEWFEDKADLVKLVESCGIYIAPRMEEGFGTSYLEAMSMGKLVIAHDAPAMNEYIVHGETGILCDFRNPSPISLENVEIIQRNAYEHCKRGYESWMENRSEIIKFIDMPPRLHVSNVYYFSNLYRAIGRNAIGKIYRLFRTLFRKLIMKLLPKKWIETIKKYRKRNNRK